jgi:hypothetical protein
MADATLVHPRPSGRDAALAARQRKAKVMAAVLSVLLAALLAYQLPHMLKRFGHTASPTATTSASAGTPVPGPSPTKEPAPILRTSGVGRDPFALRNLPDLDPGIAPGGGGRDPFAMQKAAAPSVPSVPAHAAARTLPKRLVLGTPGAHKHRMHGWIVILASIPVTRGRAAATAFARHVHGLGGVSIANSSNQRSLRGGYWVVYTGPAKTLKAVSRLVAAAHASGFRSAYIRELYQYR